MLLCFEPTGRRALHVIVALAVTACGRVGFVPAQAPDGATGDPALPTDHDQPGADGLPAPADEVVGDPGGDSAGDPTLTNITPEVTIVSVTGQPPTSIAIAFSVDDPDGAAWDVGMELSTVSATGPFGVAGGSPFPAPPFNHPWSPHTDGLDGYDGTEWLRMCADDLGGSGPGPWSAPYAYALHVNVAPTCTIGTMPATATGTLTIPVTIVEPEDGQVTVQNLQYRIGAGAWNIATGWSPTVLAVGARVVTWNTVTDLAGSYGSVTVQLTVADSNSASASCPSASFILNNNTLPTAAILSVSGGPDLYDVGVQITDPDPEPAGWSIGLQYSANAGPWTSVGPATASPTAGAVVSWDAKATLGGGWGPGNVQLAVRVEDKQSVWSAWTPSAGFVVHTSP